MFDCRKHRYCTFTTPIWAITPGQFRTCNNPAVRNGVCPDFTTPEQP